MKYIKTINELFDIAHSNNIVDGPYVRDYSTNGYKLVSDEDDGEESDNMYYYFYQPKNNKPRITVSFELFNIEAIEDLIDDDCRFDNWEFAFASGNGNLELTYLHNSIEVLNAISKIIYSFNQDFHVKYFTYQFNANEAKRYNVYKYMFEKLGFKETFETTINDSPYPTSYVIMEWI